MTGMDAPQRHRADSRARQGSGAQAPDAQISRLAFLFRPAAALALLTGAVAVQLLTKLPPTWVDAALALFGLLLILRRGWLLWLGLALLGAAWTMLRADLALSQRLSSDLEGRDLVVTGA
ncbi:MAG TPA: hypothetical protein VLC97_09005, partial [Rhodanobacteraceae bacterium]|nr:hypothetical protein [Rhodanobacteraceae bacterium]